MLRSRSIPTSSSSLPHLPITTSPCPGSGRVLICADGPPSPPRRWWSWRVRGRRRCRAARAAVHTWVGASAVRDGPDSTLQRAAAAAATSPSGGGVSSVIVQKPRTAINIPLNPYQVIGSVYGRPERMCPAVRREDVDRERDGSAARLSPGSPDCHWRWAVEA